MPAINGISSRRRLSELLFAGYPLVFADTSFRTLFLVLLLAGTASAMAMAYTSVWASETFGIGPQGVGIVFVASGLAGALSNPLLGMLSDRFGWRRPLIVGQLAVVALAYAGYTRVTDFTSALGLVALSSLSILGLVLAVVNDIVTTRPTLEKRNASRILAAVRTAWSIGVILGPAVAAAIVAVTGKTKPVFSAAVLIQIATIVLIFSTRALPVSKPRPKEIPRESKSSSQSRSRSIPKVSLAMLMLALVLIMLPTQTRTMYLPLFVTTLLREPPGMVGPLFTVTAVVATMTMPHIGAAADRFGAERVLYIGTIVGSAYCILQANTTTYPQILACQLLIGFGIALWSTSALIYLQQLMAGKAGIAGGLYVAVSQITPLVGGALIGPIAESLGIPAAFGATAFLSLVALLLLARAHRSLAARTVQLG